MKRVAVLPPAARPISKSVTSSGGEGVAAPGAALGEAAEGDEGEGGCSGRRNPKTKAAPATPPPNTATRILPAPASIYQLSGLWHWDVTTQTTHSPRPTDR